MDRSVYVSMSSAKSILQAQAVNANNLANVNTPGFREDFSRFRSLAVEGNGLSTRVYAEEETPGINLNPGRMMKTGNPLDIAIANEGYIAVIASDGTEAYTRAGDFRISPAGLLQTGKGNFVQGNGGPIAIPPAEKIEIAADGTITIRPKGQDEKTLATVNRIKLVNPDPETIYKGTDGLLRTSTAGSATPDASVKVASGFLESSNVNAVSALVEMIALSRQFEMSIRAMQTMQENDQTAQQIFQLN